MRAMCEDADMPRLNPFRRLGPVGLALTAYDIWRRLPPRQRKQVLDAARRHGPRLATQVAKRAAARRGGRPRR
jgi:hypothetical protein